MRKVFLIIALICTLPSFAGAQSGFPDRPLWLSNSKPLAGQEISLSTVLYNGTNAVTTGTLTFFVDDTSLVPQDISLPAQSSSVASAKWTATAGTHSLSAKFAIAGGNASTTRQQTTTIQITVVEPPPPSALQQNVEKAATIAGQLASTSAPFIQEVAQAVFTQTEALRNAGIEYLETKVAAGQTGSVGAETNIKGFVLGTSTKAASSSSSLFHIIGQTALSAALFTLRSFYLFYPILGLAFLFTLYWAARKVRRPRSYN